MFFFVSMNTELSFDLSQRNIRFCTHAEGQVCSIRSCDIQIKP